MNILETFSNPPTTATSTPCPRCAADPQPEGFGSPRNCAFKTGSFTPDNWNCATMHHLRVLADDESKSVQTWHNDQTATLTPVGNCGEFLVLGWYKRRGRTEQAFILNDINFPMPLTLAQANAIIDGSDIPNELGEVEL